MCEIKWLKAYRYFIRELEPEPELEKELVKKIPSRSQLKKVPSIFIGVWIRIYCYADPDLDPGPNFSPFGSRSKGRDPETQIKYE